MRTFHDLSPEEQDEFVTRFYDRFAGRLDTYAIRFEFGEVAAYIPSTYAVDPDETDEKKRAKQERTRRRVDEAVAAIGSREFVEETARAHLTGTYLLGAYAIRADNTVQWFALDFDGKNGDPYKEARDQASILQLEAGLKVYIERSQSGNGYHVWGFLDEPIEAYKVRHALKRFLEDADTYDRMFPNQDNISATRPLGNLIALPFAGNRVADGNSTFVFRNAAGVAQPFDDPLAFLKGIKANPTSKIEQLFEEAGKYEPKREVTAFKGNPEGLRDSYKLTHPLFGCEFVRWCWDHPGEVTEPLWYALLCNFAQFEDGRELAHLWSARDESRYDYDATEKKYDQALAQNKPHTCEAIRDAGGNCVCDQRFPGDCYHPFDLAKLSFMRLQDAVVLEEEATTSVAEGLDEVIAWLRQVEEDPTIGRGLPTGLPSLDRVFGRRMGEMTVVAARNSRGKTAWELEQLLYLSRELGIATKLYSLEMPGRQLWMRALSPLAEVSQTRMATGSLTTEDWRRIQEAREVSKDIPFFIDDATAHLDSLLESAARFVGPRVRRGEKAVVAVDYLQIIPRLPKENEQDQIGRSVTAWKRFAKIMGCHVDVLCQLNRGAEDATGDSQATDSWLRGSDVIAFVADNVLIIIGEKGPGIVERVFVIHKQRNGEAGIRIPFEFNQPFMRFGEVGAWRQAPPRVTPNTPHEDAFSRAQDAGAIPIVDPFEDLD